MGCGSHPCPHIYSPSSLASILPASLTSLQPCLLHHDQPPTPVTMPSLGSNNHSTAQLVGTAVASGAVVASLILGYQRLRREHNIDKLKHSIPQTSKAEQLNEFGLVSPTSGHLSKEDERSAALAARALKGDYDEGTHPLPPHPKPYQLTQSPPSRAHPRTTRTQPRISRRRRARQA